MIYKNKKGYIFVGIVVVMTTAALLYALTTLNAKYTVEDAKGVEREIGRVQAEIFSAYQDGESAGFYISQSGKLALEKTIKKLAFNNSGCGTHFGFSVWTDSEQTCYPTPEEIDKRIVDTFNQELNAFVAQYRQTTLITSNHIFSIQNQNPLTIRGVSESPLVFSFGDVSTYTPPQIDQIFEPTPLKGLGSCFAEASARSQIPILAIAAVTSLESGNGKDAIAGELCIHDETKIGPSFNLFGIKSTSRPGTAGSCNWRTTECLTSAQEASEDVLTCEIQDTFGCALQGKKACTVLAPFRAYNTRCDSINDFVNLIQTNWYWEGTGEGSECNPVKNLLNDPAAFIRGVHNCGYSTSPTWSDKVITQMTNFREILGSGQVGGNNGLYSVNIDVVSEKNYDLNEYQEIVSEVKVLADHVKKECTSGEETQAECLQRILPFGGRFRPGDECSTLQEREAAQESSPTQFRVCALSKHSLPDETGKKVSLVYRISFFAGDEIPPSKVTNVQVTNTPDVGQSLTVSFDKHIEPDVAHYIIYYADNTFTEITDDLQKAVIPQPEDLVQIIVQQDVVVEDDTTHYFAVIANDTSGNTDLTEFDIVSETSIDNLNPKPVASVSAQKNALPGTFADISFTPPTQNTDDSALTDLMQYQVYAFNKIASCDVQAFNSALSLNQVSKEIINCGATCTQTPYTLQNIELPAVPYCVAVIAHDATVESEPNPSQYSDDSIAEVQS